MEEKYLTVKELAVYIRYGADRVYRLVKQGKIPHIRKFGKILFDKDVIDAWLKNGG